MVSNTALNSETICDPTGQPLDRGAAALLKAIDQLLTVGSYYSAEHDQYRVVSEKACAQIVEAIGSEGFMTIEITAAGMMVRSQLVDPRHRNVRLLHDLLVPLKIAQLELRAELTPADLRQAISALQEHKLSLGNTTGFQEIKIENLPPTISTASRGVVRNNGIEGDDGLGGDLQFPDELMTESDKLARKFMAIVSRILKNLESGDPGSDESGSTLNSDSTPENIKALREALQRLVEVNPTPRELTRLIANAKRALDLSQDPGSVDLVFSLLKKEIETGDAWRDSARENAKNKPEMEYGWSLEQLKQTVDDLKTAGCSPAEPRPSSLSNYLGICIHLLGADPSEVLEKTLVSNLELIITNGEVTRQDLNLCSAAVATSALKDNQVALDTVLPTFCRLLRVYLPDYLVKFWTRLWESLDSARRALVWPHLVSDLLLGLDDTSFEAAKQLWLAAGELDPRAAIKQVSRLECTPAVRTKTIDADLMSLPLDRMYAVHMALMRSSLAPVHGPRIHEHLLRHPPNGLTEILMRALGKYDPSNDGFYLSLIKRNDGASVSPDLRRMAIRLISETLTGLPASDRNAGWVTEAISWIAKLDPGLALPLLARIRDQRKLFFFKAWPVECRELAEKIISDAKDGR